MLQKAMNPSVLGLTLKALGCSLRTTWNLNRCSSFTLPLSAGFLGSTFGLSSVFVSFLEGATGFSSAAFFFLSPFLSSGFLSSFFSVFFSSFLSSGLVWFLSLVEFLVAAGSSLYHFVFLSKPKNFDMVSRNSLFLVSFSMKSLGGEGSFLSLSSVCSSSPACLALFGFPLMS